MNRLAVAAGDKLAAGVSLLWPGARSVRGREGSGALARSTTPGWTTASTARLPLGRPRFASRKKPVKFYLYDGREPRLQQRHVGRALQQGGGRSGLEADARLLQAASRLAALCVTSDGVPHRTSAAEACARRTTSSRCTRSSAMPRAMAYWSSPPHADIGQSRNWLQSMIDIRLPEGEDFIVEHDGQLIGKADFGASLRSASSFIRTIGAGASRARRWASCSAAPSTCTVCRRSMRTSIRGTKARSSCFGSLGFRETGRKERTWLVGEEWCDSVYLELDASSWRSRP